MPALTRNVKGADAMLCRTIRPEEVTICTTDTTDRTSIVHGKLSHPTPLKAQARTSGARQRGTELRGEKKWTNLFYRAERSPETLVVSSPPRTTGARKS